jgi:ABC-type transport system involved in multi-copper enzyme maturation permease subunit
MRSLIHLVVGELVRLVKYKTLIFGLIVSVMWVAVVAFVDEPTARGFLPFLAMLDAGMMSVILLSASFYMEKQESTIKTLLVTPVSLEQVLAAKVIALILSALLSAALVLGAGYLIHGIESQFLLVILYVVLIVTANTAIGYMVILASKDFTGMLMKYMGLVLLFMIPSFLYYLNLLEESQFVYLIVSPLFASELLIKSVLGGGDVVQIVLACVYLGVLGFLLYWKSVYPRFRRFAIGG